MHKDNNIRLRYYGSYDEGYEDGVESEKITPDRGPVSNFDSLEEMLGLLLESPWLLQKVKDIFDSQGWDLSRKSINHNHSIINCLTSINDAVADNPPTPGEKESK